MDVENTLDRALSEISNSNDLRSLDEVRVSFLGKKGELTSLLKSLGQMDPTERPKAGEAINQAKSAIQDAIEHRKASLANSQLEKELATGSVDITCRVDALFWGDCTRLLKCSNGLRSCLLAQVTKW